MPPESPVPGWCNGEVWTDKIAMRSSCLGLINISHLIYRSVDDPDSRRISVVKPYELSQLL
jgi:hypothetical protein